MPTIRRLTDSCLVVTTDDAVNLFDPGFFTFESREVDLDSIGEVSRVLITHEHRDHVHPAFVRWLLDRRSDLVVHSNQAVVDLLAGEEIQATTDTPRRVSVEDVAHETLPNGAAPPNRAFTIEGVFTHPGDSYQPISAAPVMALPLITPWGSATQAVEFAGRLAPDQVVPIHDFYLSSSGRRWINDIVTGALEAKGVELVPLDWGESFTI